MHPFVPNAGLIQANNRSACVFQAPWHSWRLHSLLLFLSASITVHHCPVIPSSCNNIPNRFPVQCCVLLRAAESTSDLTELVAINLRSIIKGSSTQLNCCVWCVPILSRSNHEKRSIVKCTLAVIYTSVDLYKYLHCAKVNEGMIPLQWHWLRNKWCPRCQEK